MLRQMKNSGYQWMGEIPTEWGVSKVGNFFYFSSGDTLTSESILNEGKYLVYGANGVRGYYNASNLSGKHILLGRVGALCGNVHIVEGDIWVTEHALVAHTKNKVCEEYYGYTFEAMNLLQYSKASAQPVISSDTISNLRFPVPTLAEQRRIADYLDKKCTEIDAVIEKTKATIEEYRKLKQSIITEAVTKGIRGDRPMKNSGIEWIGEIPADWKEIKLKYCTYVRARLGWKGLKADEYVETGYPLLSAFNIINNKLDFSEVNYINQFRYDESPEIKLMVNDILLVKDGAGIGKCAIVENLLIPSTPNGSLAVITVEKYLTPKFLYYYFLSTMFQKYIDQIKDGMGVPHLFQSDLRDIKIVFGCETEQIEIVEYLDKKCSEVDVLIAKKTALLEEMESYKKSVIYEYVTGKKEVIL